MMKSISPYLALMYAISLFAFVYLGFCQGANDAAPLFLLPLAYLVGICLFGSMYKEERYRLPLIIVNLLYLIRLVVLPIAFLSCGEVQLFSGKANVAGYYADACVFMAYEYLCVQLALFVLIRFFLNRPAKRAIRERHERNSVGNVAVIILVLMLIFVCFVEIALPSSAPQFKTVLGISDVDFTSASQDAVMSRGSIARAVATLVTMAVQIVRVMLPAVVLGVMKRRGCSLFAIRAVLLVLCVAQFMLLTSTFAEALIASAVVVLCYTRIVGEDKGDIGKILLVAVVFVAGVYFFVRYSIHGSSLYSTSNGFLFYASQVMNAYFSGLDNVAASFLIPDGFQGEALRADLLGAIPFNGTLFGEIGHKLQFFFNEYAMSYGQIPPTISAGRYYFGSIFAPLPSVAFAAFSLLLYRAALHQCSLLRYCALLFCSFAFILGLGMYSFAISLSWFFSWGVPMALVSLLDADRAIDLGSER